MRRPLLIVGMGAFAIGCLRPVADVQNRFLFQGTVTDEQSKGLPGVEVYFIDTGIAQRAPEEQLVGRTDQRGFISVVFDYWWSRNAKRPAGRKDRNSFQVALRSGGGGVVSVLEFDLARLKRDGGSYVVPIDAVIKRKL